MNSVALIEEALIAIGALSAIIVTIGKTVGTQRVYDFRLQSLESRVVRIEKKIDELLSRH